MTDSERLPCKLYLDLQVAALRQEIAALREQHARDRETLKTDWERAERANDKRFDSVNEFRSTMSDQAAHYLQREVYEAGMNDLRHRIDVLAEKQLPREVYEQQHEDLRRRFEALASQYANQSGETLGTRATIAVVMSIGILIISIITFVIDKTFK